MVIAQQGKRLQVYFVAIAEPVAVLCGQVTVDAPPDTVAFRANAE